MVSYIRELRHVCLFLEEIMCSLCVLNKNALTPAVRLACLEIRSRNEEAINSTLNRIYSLKDFYFLPDSTTVVSFGNTN